MTSSSDQQTAAATRAIPLSNANLGAISAAVSTPSYARNRLVPSIAHIGVGGFHRAHQELYLDDLANSGVSLDWGVCGIGLLPPDKRMEEALLSQDCLYTLVERSADREHPRVIGALTQYLFAPEQREHALQTLAGDQTRVVSLTITEGGYNFDQVTGEFDASSPDVIADLEHPETPSTVFGYLCEALNRRRLAGRPPFTVLSCDNVQSNGSTAKRVIVAFATLRDPSLAAWIDGNVAFPNAMVDRITPATEDRDREMVASRFGIRDAWPVMAEPFRQWVIEDQFCNGRPPLEEVGVQFVDNVLPYELMKMRLLNASHQAMAYMGYLCDYRYVDDLMSDPQFRTFIARMMDKEITQHLAPVPGIDLVAYKRSLIERFSNPKVRDQVLRLCFDASARMPKFLLPTLAEGLASGQPTQLLTLAVAGWLRFLSGTDEHAQPIPIEDQLRTELNRRALQGKADPRPLLEMRSLFGGLSENERFVAALEDALGMLYRSGARATLTHYLQRGSQTAGNGR
jgi:mannitol 2-dehydrogenase